MCAHIKFVRQLQVVTEIHLLENHLFSMKIDENQWFKLGFSGFLSSFCVGKYSLIEFFLEGALELAAKIQDYESSDDF